MKLTETQLRQLIQEELDQALEEGRWDQFKAWAGGAKDVAGVAPEAIGAAAKGAWAGLTGKGGAVPARKGGTFARGKATRLLTSHVDRMIKTLQGSVATLEKLQKDFEKDVEALGLNKYKEIEDISKELSGELVSLYEDEIPRATQRLQSLLGTMLAGLEGAELAKPPAPDAPPADPSKRGFMGLPPGPTVTESADEKRPLEEHFKRFL